MFVSSVVCRKNSLPSRRHNHGCQMDIAGFLDRICLALWASGLWLCNATLQNLIASFPWIAPGWRALEGIKFCHLSTLAITESHAASISIRILFFMNLGSPLFRHAFSDALHCIRRASFRLHTLMEECRWSRRRLSSAIFWRDM